MSAPIRLLGLAFPNRVGLAAGLDKNGDHLEALGALGFGFIELGTVTPLPQEGNPRPRLFRLPAQRALINRLGFNNKGVDHLVGRLRRRRYDGVVGVNIGKNRDTSLASAVEDYRVCLQRVYPYADYVAVNISSPNTPGLRDLQHTAHVNRLLGELKREQSLLRQRYARVVPLLLKLSPDMEPAALETLTVAIREHGVDGVIASNTTISRPAMAEVAQAQELGGLSGRPLANLAMNTLRALRQRLAPEVPIIGAGGIGDAEAAVARHRAGADLVALYTGLIYEGPHLIAQCARALADCTRDDIHHAPRG